METTPRWLVATLSGVCLAVVYLFYGHVQSQAELGVRFDETRKSRFALEARVASLERRLAETEAALQATGDELARTLEEQERTRALARRNRLEHRRLASRLSGDLLERMSGLVANDAVVEKRDRPAAVARK
jgi:chromosome segregation ATPase